MKYLLVALLALFSASAVAQNHIVQVPVVQSDNTIAYTELPVGDTWQIVVCFDHQETLNEGYLNCFAVVDGAMKKIDLPYTKTDQE